MVSCSILRHYIGRKLGELPGQLVGEGELDLRVMELLDVVSLAKGRWDDGSLDDLDAGEPHSVPRSHLLQKTTIQCFVSS